jgi:hypothetical protein
MSTRLGQEMGCLFADLERSPYLWAALSLLAMLAMM